MLHSYDLDQYAQELRARNTPRLQSLGVVEHIELLAALPVATVPENHPVAVYAEGISRLLRNWPMLEAQGLVQGTQLLATFSTEGSGLDIGRWSWLLNKDDRTFLLTSTKESSANSEPVSFFVVDSQTPSSEQGPGFEDILATINANAGATAARCLHTQNTLAAFIAR